MPRCVTHRLRTTSRLGFVVTPFITAIITATISPIGRGEGLIAWGLIPIFYFFALLTTGFLGVPSFLLLRHFNLISWWSTAITGLFIGTLVGVILRLPSAPNVHDLIPPMLIGATSAISFWVIWRSTTHTL
jgi:hypothetical protein